jgi:hypothetical protein
VIQSSRSNIYWSQNNKFCTANWCQLDYNKFNPGGIL